MKIRLLTGNLKGSPDRFGTRRFFAADRATRQPSMPRPAQG